MLSPKAASLAFGIPNFEPGNDYRYAMLIAATLMLGYIDLLVWADRKPVERKGVLLLTIFAVLAGLIVFSACAVTSGFVAADKMLPSFHYV